MNFNHAIYSGYLSQRENCSQIRLFRSGACSGKKAGNEGWVVKVGMRVEQLEQKFAGGKEEVDGTEGAFEC